MRIPNRSTFFDLALGVEFHSPDPLLQLANHPLTFSFLAEVVIAPPALYLLLTREHLRKEIEVAAQNVFDKSNGAYTGEISAEQLKDSGITWTLVGHSERRVIMGEDDDVSTYCLNRYRQPPREETRNNARSHIVADDPCCGVVHCQKDKDLA